MISWLKSTRMTKLGRGSQMNLRWKWQHHVRCLQNHHIQGQQSRLCDERAYSPRLGAGCFCVRSWCWAGLLSDTKLCLADCVEKRRLTVGWSRRPRTMRTCGADSTRIHHAVMERPAFGAAITERWSERGSGVRHGSGPLTTSGRLPGPKGRAGSPAKPSLHLLARP